MRQGFEPACGTGRLLVKLAAAGYQVAGNDLSRKAVDYCNARLARHGFPAAATVGDMADFRLPRKVDAGLQYDQQLPAPDHRGGGRRAPDVHA